jgi:lipoprotein-anchoring transpeptidase ErfK/SrfK
MSRRRSMRALRSCAVLGAVAAALAGNASAGTTYKQGADVAWVRGASAALQVGPSAAPTPVASRTPFGTPTTFSVMSTQPGWARVISTDLPNGRLGWIPSTQVRLTFDPYALEVDLSRRTLVVWRAGTIQQEIPVGIGAPGSATPHGQFAITDRLRNFDSEAYGCCLLVLSGHQTHLRSGWTGGDRLAIHVGSGIGAAVSNGCLHASDPAMRWLLDRIPLGTRIVIHA